MTSGAVWPRAPVKIVSSSQQQQRRRRR